MVYVQICTLYEGGLAELSGEEGSEDDESNYIRQIVVREFTFKVEASVSHSKPSM